MDTAEYCRQLETYLCQKNEGHLIRIVGPVFEQVCGWAEQGVPLNIAYRGIDRYCERAQARGGPRRRPVRIEFCEADILEAFDDWRRAVGVRARVEDDTTGHARTSLPAHLDRVIARLTVARGGGRSAGFSAACESIVGELDRTRATARTARGDERTRILSRLQQLDDDLMRAAKDEVDHDTLVALGREAAAEMAPFVSRMASDARAQAEGRAFERLVRDRLSLPVIAFE